MMFQMLQAIVQYSGAATDHPRLYLWQFMEVARNFKIHGVIDDAFRLTLFPHSLRDKVKCWLNLLESNSITT